MTEHGTLNTGGQRYRCRSEIEQRRMQVAWLVLCRASYRQIAARLGVSLGTIASDVEAVRDEWRVRAAETYENFVAEEVAKLDLLEARLFPHALIGGEGGGPDLSAVDRVLHIIDRRARLLGRTPATVEFRANLEAEIQLLLNRRDQAVRCAIEPLDAPNHRGSTQSGSADV